MATSQKTREIYERQASRFDRERSKTLFERSWLELFCQNLPPHGSVLDVGCGSGDPISKYFIDNGYHLTGVDFAHAMLNLAANRFPEATWVLRDMEALCLEKHFDGVIAWHSFFHLEKAGQRSTLPRLADHVAPGGVLMATVGPVESETTGTVGDETVYHASLSEEEYRSLLHDAKMEITHFVRNDPACGGATILLAKKR